MSLNSYYHKEYNYLISPLPKVRHPKFSVITVVFNGAKVLEDTIKSVISQGYKDLEYIIIDGGSSDSTSVIIDKYRQYITCCISEKDSGIADAMNKGIAHSSGELLNFLNAGDSYIDSSVLTDIAAWFDSERWWWGYGLAKFLLGFSETEYKQSYRKFSRFKNFYLTQGCHQAVFYRRELFDAVGFYRTDNDRVFDRDFWFRASKYSSPSQIDKYLVWYDLTGVSTGVHWSIVCDWVKLSWQHSQYRLLSPLWISLIVFRYFKSLAGVIFKKILAFKATSLTL